MRSNSGNILYVLFMQLHLLLIAKRSFVITRSMEWYTHAIPLWNVHVLILYIAHKFAVDCMLLTEVEQARMRFQWSSVELVLAIDVSLPVCRNFKHCTCL